MSTKIFVNLPVKALDKSKEFFSKLGFEFNPQFTDQNAACMIISEENFVMLLTEDFFKKFTGKEISDSTNTSEVIVALSAESREKVDEMFNQAIEAGGAKSSEPQDHGFMYQHGFQDLDGHLWEIVYMEENAASQSA